MESVENSGPIAPTKTRHDLEWQRLLAPLSDRASPNLRQLRAEYAANRARMISRIEELIRRHESILQDGFWTEREGRYVLPVRSDSHERFPGIVHASSGSGATLFVEPRV